MTISLPYPLLVSDAGSYYAPIFGVECLTSLADSST